MSESTCQTDEYGTQRWFSSEGLLHRTGDLPALIYTSGTVAYYEHGKLHRLDNPATIYSHGLKLWYHHGRLHNEKSHALESADCCTWYVHGELIDCKTQEEFEVIMKRRKTE